VIYQIEVSTWCVNVSIMIIITFVLKQFSLVYREYVLMTDEVIWQNAV